MSNGNMNRRSWQNIYGDAPEEFRVRLRQTLNGLEENGRERKLNRRYKTSTVFVAAAILLMLLAGAGIAASELGVFHLLQTSDPIVPLQGVEEMVATNLGASENEYAVLTVEQAVFDGQGVMVQCRLSPKEMEKYALLDEMMQEVGREDYDFEYVPLEVMEGTQGEYGDDGSSIEIINEADDQRLLMNGVETQIPDSREEAVEKDLPVYREGSRLYYAEHETIHILGRRDGRQIMGYWLHMDTDSEMLSENSSDAQEQEDGSLLFWAEGSADEELALDTLKVCVKGSVELDGVYYPLEEIKFALPKTEAERRYKIVPVGDGKLERFELLSGSVAFTKVRGYMKLDYYYEEADDEMMDVCLNVYDADGNPITFGGGACHNPEENLYHESIQLQSFEEAPERIWLEVMAIGRDDDALGRIECKLIEE